MIPREDGLDQSMNELEGQAARAFLWDSGGAFAGLLSTFVLGVVLARLLTPGEFGLVAMVTVFIGLVQGLMDVGLGVALVQRRHPEAVHYNSTFWLNGALGVVLCSLTIAGAPLVARFYGEPQLAQITRVLALSFLLRSMTLVHEARFRKNLDFKILTQVRLTSSILGGLTGVLLAWNEFGVWSLVAQSLTSAAVAMVGVWALGDWRPGRHVSRKALGDLWSFGFPMFAAGLLDTIFTRVDVLIVGRLFDAVELGFFTRAKSLVRLVVRFSSDSVSRVMFPVLSSIQDQERRFQRATLQTVSLVAFAAVGLTSWMYVTADPLVVVLLTEKWRPTAPLLQLFCLSAWGYPINSVILSVLKSKGRSGTFLKLEIVKKALYFLALIVGFRWGIRGYLGGLAFVNLANTTINAVATAGFAGLKARDLFAVIAPYGVAAGAAVALCAFVPSGDLNPPCALAVLSGVLTAVYLAATMTLGADGPRLAIATLRRLKSGVSR